ncbi:MAG: hypothetical protein LUC91_01230 [Prevotella sp.]|nr:hypothetical protein [Prevotella sp.]
MIVSIFGPCGIVTASTNSDRFLEMKEMDGQSILTPIHIPGFPHTYVFWDKYVLTYNFMNTYTYDSSFIYRLKQLEEKWTERPSIVDFMPYLKKTIVDFNYQIIGVVSGYDYNENVLMPYVYQVLGENIRRVNMDASGNITYSYIYLEKKPLIWKLMQKVKVLNGDKWEESDEIPLRCELFSIEKSKDMCGFFLKTYDFVSDINSRIFKETFEADAVINYPDKIEFTKIKI